MWSLFIEAAENAFMGIGFIFYWQGGHE